MKKYSILLFFLLFISLGFGQSKVDSIFVQKLLNEAYTFESTNPQKALKIYRNVYNISNKIKYPIGAFKSTMYSGIVYSDLANYDSALYFYRKAIPLSSKANSLRSEALTYINIGNVYQYKGILDSVAGYYIKAISKFETLKDSTSISQAYINLSTLFETLGQIDKQIEYLKKAVKTIPKQNIEQLGMCYGNLGIVYINKENSELALKNFNLSDSISKLDNLPRLDFFSLRNFGEYYRYKESYEEAILSYEKALLKGKDINDEYFKNDLLLKLGEVHVELKNFSKANFYLKQALEMGIKTKTIEIQQKASLVLSKVSLAQGSFKNAYNYLQNHTKLKDSLLNISKIKNINELEIKYQTEKKDKEIAEQQLALEKNESKTRTMNVLIVSLLLASILLWFLYQQRQKRKNQEILTLKREHQVQTLESLMEGEEKERFRIAKELHDGVNGDLSAIKFKLSSLLEMNNTVIKEAVSMIDKSCQQVRAISHNLVPPSLQDFNLIEALEEYCTNMNAIHSPEISFQQLGDAIVLTKKQEANIFRIVQELVNNSIKHTEAGKINVQISSRENTIQLTIEDNGKGYDQKTIKTDGIGLKNIQSRVDYLNASLDVVSNAQGTSTSIEIDINK